MPYPYSGGTSIPIYEGEPEPQPSGSFGSFQWPNINLEGAGPAIGAAGYGAEAINAIMAGIAAKRRAEKIANYNAQVAEANAQAQAMGAEVEAQQYERQAAIARQDQGLAQQAQAWREYQEQERNAQVLGQTRAIIAGSGLMLSGSPLAMYENTARQQGLEMLAQRYQTALQVRASGEQATEAEYGAAMARWGAGERLRIGGQQAGLIRGTVDESQVAAGFMRAGAAVVQGAAKYNELSEKQRSKSLVAG